VRTFKKRRSLRDESGFTLTEVLVTIMIMVVVLFALYSIFDMGLRVFAFGNDKLEAVENARLGLERMEREVRAAYPYDRTNEESDDDYLFPLDECCMVWGCKKGAILLPTTRGRRWPAPTSPNASPRRKRP